MSDRYNPAAGDIVEVTRAMWHDEDYHPWNGTRLATVKNVSDLQRAFLIPVEPITTPPAPGMDAAVWASDAAGMWWDNESLKPVKTNTPAPQTETIADSNPLFAWVFEGDGIGQGNLDVFVDAFGYAANTDVTIDALYVAHNGELHKVERKVQSGKFNEDDYATATVTVTLPDGSTLTGSYRIDGRA